MLKNFFWIKLSFQYLFVCGFVNFKHKKYVWAGNAFLNKIDEAFLKLIYMCMNEYSSVQE
jgi:hypothetical protein